MLTPTITPEITIKTETETLPQISSTHYLAEIIRLLRKEEDTVFGKEGINNNRVLCARLDEVADFLGDKNRKTEALRFLDLFYTAKNIGKREIENFLDKLYTLEDININKYPGSEDVTGIEVQQQRRKVEILRQVFTSFGVTKREPRGHTNLILNAYIGYIEDGYFGRGMIDFDKFLDYDKFDSTEGVLFLGPREGINLARVGGLIDEVVGTVDAIHGADTGDNGISVEDTTTNQSRTSWKKLGGERRRIKSKENRVSITEERALEEKILAYQQALEKVQSLGLNIDQQLTEFSRFLMGHMPFVREVVHYLETLSEISRLVQELQRISESLKEGSRSDEIGDMERELVNLNGDITFYETEITIAQGRINTEVKKDSPVSLVVSNTNSLIRNYTQKKEKAIREKVRLEDRIARTGKKEEERIQKNTARIEQLNIQASTIHSRIQELDAIIQNGRIRKISTIDEFKSGYYTSLRAQEFYTTPTTLTEKEVSINWIESNILYLLVEVLKNLDAIDKQIILEGISLPKIVELLTDIEGINPTDSNYDIASLPDIENVSQGKVAKLISYFMDIIPADKLDTIPIFISDKRPEKSKEPKKTKSQKRREDIKKSEDSKLEKDGIRSIIQSLEVQQEGFEKYWKLKIEAIESDLRGIARAIEATAINSPLKNGKFKGKNIDELPPLKVIKLKELESLQKYISSNTLDTNIELFEKIKREIARLQKKLSKI